MTNEKKDDKLYLCNINKFYWKGENIMTLRKYIIKNINEQNMDLSLYMNKREQISFCVHLNEIGDLMHDILI